jgi:hypothetical protein
MTRFGVLGATALSLSLAIATPVLAQQAPGSKAGAHAAAGARMGSGPRMQSNFRGAQGNVGAANFAGRGNAQFVPRGNAQFAQRGGEFRGDRGRGFGRDAGFAAAAGVATGAAIAAGGYGYGYSGQYYGDNYAYDPNYAGDGYDNSYAYDNGDQQAWGDQTTVAVGGDASYCAQRYRSYDPASGTYLGFDGLRHPFQ